MERAIAKLSQLSDVELFTETATGIEHIIKGVAELHSAARALSGAGNEYPARILGNLAEEEAAKVLILMDVIRCPRDRREERLRLLGYFYKHLPKGIYIEVCEWGGILTFRELTR